MYYLLIIAVISFGFSVALYQIGTHDLAFGLHRQTQRISTDFPVFSGSPYLSPGSELHEGSHRLLSSLIGFNVLVLVVAGFASYALARRTLQPIEQAHEQQKRFTADVSHELRTPLTALKMESEVALMDSAASKSDLRAVIGSNVEEAEKLTVLVNNLLRLSRLDADDQPVVFEPVAITAVLRAAIDQVKSVASKQQVEVINESKVATFVTGEQDTLVQLFVILLDNAIKYSPPKAKVIIQSHQLANSLEVTVADTGQGIPKADLEHVFERFYRADTARGNTQTSGFGLGLSIAKMIADNYGATLSLTSRVGRGTTAKVMFPKVEATPAADQPPKPPTSPA